MKHSGVDASKLTLNLDFGAMDFGAIASATEHALQQERNHRQPHTTTTPTSVNEHVVHDEADVGNEHGSREHKGAMDHRGGEGGARYTLMDRLQDCAVGGEWRRAHRLFTQALDQSCRQVMAASNNNNSSSTNMKNKDAPTNQDHTRPLTSDQRAACFPALYKLVADLPPFQADLPDGADYYRRARRNLVGLLRWNGHHYFILFKVLAAEDRWTELEQVLATMKAIGYLDHQVDGRTLNGLLSVMRRGPMMDVARYTISPLNEQHRGDGVSGSSTPSSSSSSTSRGEVMRRMVMEMEEVAKRRDIHLGHNNQRMIGTAHAAQALQRSEARGDDDDAGAPSQDLSSLRIGDFDGLLRACTSEASTQRVLAMMKKAGVECGPRSYANIIASLHNPQYLLSATDSGSGASDTKEEYERKKELRMARATKWHDCCPEHLRHAEVFNEMMYLHRSTTHTAAFNALLTQFRGNAIRGDEERASMWASKKLANTTSSSSSSSSSCAPTPILAPAWTTTPNGKTYELLVQRLRYFHDFDGMWELYVEMRRLKVAGTAKLYQVLLDEARAHPPHRLLVGITTDSSRLILDIYDEMKQHSLDVTTLANTVSLLNAWSSSKHSRRWTGSKGSSSRKGHMSAHESLHVVRSQCAHYYHCALYDIPFEMPVSQIAENIVPRQDSPIVKALSESHCRIVPHQLHVYKEALEHKFGYVSFYVHHAAHSTLTSEEVHQYMRTWVDEELSMQLAIAHCKVRLAQPPECYSSEPFLEALNRLCSILNPAKVADTRKVETFLLTKIFFNEMGNNKHCNRERRGSAPHKERSIGSMEDGSPHEEDENDLLAWTELGTITIKSLTSRELTWLKKMFSAEFPPLLVTNNDFLHATCDANALRTFFVKGLSPLITVEEEA